MIDWIFDIWSKEPTALIALALSLIALIVSVLRYKHDLNKSRRQRRKEAESDATEFLSEAFVLFSSVTKSLEELRDTKVHKDLIEVEGLPDDLVKQVQFMNTRKKELIESVETIVNSRLTVCNELEQQLYNRKSSTKELEDDLRRTHVRFKEWKQKLVELVSAMESLKKRIKSINTLFEEL